MTERRAVAIDRLFKRRLRELRPLAELAYYANQFQLANATARLAVAQAQKTYLQAMIGDLETRQRRAEAELAKAEAQP